MFDNRSNLQAPTLHTNFPIHKSSSVHAPPKKYKNVWDTSMFYPAAVHAKARGDFIPIDAVSQEARVYHQELEPPNPAFHNFSMMSSQQTGTNTNGKSMMNQTGKFLSSQQNEDTLDAVNSFKQVVYNRTHQGNWPASNETSAAETNFGKSTMSASQHHHKKLQSAYLPQDNLVANVEASIFGGKTKSHYEDRQSSMIGDEYTLKSTTTATRNYRNQSVRTADETLSQQPKTSPFQQHPRFSQELQQQELQHPEQAEQILNTNARNAAFKINMPHSQARMPEYLPQESIRPKPFIAQRRKVHSYIYPSKFDLLRYEMKSKLRDQMTYSNPQKNRRMTQTAPSQEEAINSNSIEDYDFSFQEGTQHSTIHNKNSMMSNMGTQKRQDQSPIQYKQIGVQPGEIVELTDENTIPQRALRQTLDKTHEMLKAWKLDQVPRKTTFSQAKRFDEAQAIYGPRMANFSLIDINDHFKNYNGAPKIDKFSQRSDFFMKKAPETEEEMLLRRYTLMKPVPKEDQQEEQSAEPEPSFLPAEHEKVQNMKPYIKQIIKDMKHHTQAFQL